MKKSNFFNYEISIAFSKLVKRAALYGYRIGMVVHREFLYGPYQTFNSFDAFDSRIETRTPFSRGNSFNQKYKDLPHGAYYHFKDVSFENRFKFSYTKDSSCDYLGIEAYDIDKFGVSEGDEKYEA